MVPHGLCIIEDCYFSDFPSIRHMDNKHESRPYYLAVQGSDKIIWMVPISHQVEKYKGKIARDEQRHGHSIFCCVGKIKGEERAFLTGNVIPVTEAYIKRPFTVNGVPYIIQDKELIKQIQYNVGRYIALVRQGRLSPAVDIIGIERVLLNRMKNDEYVV